MSAEHLKTQTHVRGVSCSLLAVRTNKGSHSRICRNKVFVQVAKILEKEGRLQVKLGELIWMGIVDLTFLLLTHFTLSFVIAEHTRCSDGQPDRS